MNQEFTLSYAVKINEWNRVGRWRSDVICLLREMGVQEGGLLDVGCNMGSLIGLVKELHPKVDYLSGADVNVKALKWARVKHPQVLFIALKDDFLTHPPETFNYATLVHTLGHAYTPSRLLRSIRRVLKPGGILGVIGPNRKFYEWMKPYNFFTGYVGDSTIKHEWSLREYRAIAEYGGFDVVEASEFGDRVWWLKYAKVIHRFHKILGQIPEPTTNIQQGVHRLKFIDIQQGVCS